MAFFTINGIILKVVPYSERAWVAKVFAPETGITGVYISQHNARGVGLTPLAHVEMVVRATTGELLQCREVKLLNDFAGLRRTLATVEAAGEMVQALLATQMEGRPADMLFALFLDYLRRLEQGADPKKVLGSFLGKLLRYEGVWSDEPPGEVAFSEAEWEAARALAYCRTGKELELLQCDAVVFDKLARLLRERLCE